MRDGYEIQYAFIDELACVYETAEALQRFCESMRVHFGDLCEFADEGIDPEEEKKRQQRERERQLRPPRNVGPKPHNAAGPQHVARVARSHCRKIRR